MKLKYKIMYDLHNTAQTILKHFKKPFKNFF